MFIYHVLLATVAGVWAGPATDASYKGQFCTDPRTMRKHAAYTEWADAYSCTRHRCQPGGRNLAIYTVGCKRVEAPESAIECEEVVEDTNMQFPYCCTRLRCLVVVRGEVWTRVLGQPWETLPAAPWSHMYKMKKPPPADGTFLPSKGEGPIYELQTETDTEHDKQSMRSKKASTEGPDCADNAVARAAPAAPDIVIALATSSDKEPRNNKKTETSRYFPGENNRHKRGRKQNISQGSRDVLDDEAGLEPRIEELDEAITEKEKLEPASDERYYANAYGVTQKSPPKIQPHHQVAWTEIPQNQWNEHEPAETDPAAGSRGRHQQDAVDFEPQQQAFHQPEFPTPEEKKEEKPGNLQALVDAIGTRMRDIENVVQRMSEKVHQAKPGVPEAEFASGEKGYEDITSQLWYIVRNKISHIVSGGAKTSPSIRAQDNETEQQHHLVEHVDEGKGKMKKPNPDSEHYNRFSSRNHGSKYLHSATDVTTEQPLFVEDTNVNGYYSDGTNTVRRSPPKEPAATYMAPVENRRKAPGSEEAEKKHKKHMHKKKKVKGHHKKHHAKDEKRKRFNRINSVESDRNAVSLEDSSALATSQNT